MQLTQIFILAFAALASARCLKGSPQDAGNKAGNLTTPGTGAGGGTGTAPKNAAGVVPAASGKPSSALGISNTPAKQAAPVVLPSSSQASSPAPSSGGSSSSSGSGQGLKASFTQYTDCKSPRVACGYYNEGLTAAVSQALFGVGSGGGPGPTCGSCYKLSSPTAGTKSIVVKVNNLCPVEGNPLCAQAMDTDVNFDLCADTGTGAALFGTSGTTQVNGTAVKVDCSQWSGGPNLS